jgi:hypothetical protein
MPGQHRLLKKQTVRKFWVILSAKWVASNKKGGEYLLPIADSEFAAILSILLTI